MLLSSINSFAETQCVTGPCGKDKGSWYHVITFDSNGHIDYIDIWDCNGEHSRRGGCVIQPGGGGFVGGQLYFDNGNGVWAKEVVTADGEILGFYGRNADGTNWHAVIGENSLN